MKHGASTMFTMFASQSARIATAASPTARKIALTTKRRKMVALPPIISAVYDEPVETTSASAPMSASRRGAAIAPTSPRSAASAIAMTTTCTAATAAPPASFSPARRAMTAVAAADRPIASA